MEEVLRQLQEAMHAHRQAIAKARAPQAAAGTPAAAAAYDERGAVIQRLARDLERVSGIEIGGMMEAKLGRVLASVSLPSLGTWVARLHLLPADHPEWLSLIENLTVHETFFHRDRSQLELLRRRLLPELIGAAARQGRYRLRFWSAGCATGEEAYTLAILGLLALRDAGFAEETPDGIACIAPWEIDVLGSDISRQVLTRAMAAVYPAQELGSFRDLPVEFERFFPMLPPAADAPGVELHGVNAAVCRNVRFGRFNLVNPAPPETGFDIVLCRNVLIYLTMAARARALSVLQQALRPSGYLMLGSTDALARNAPYDVCWGDGAVAYRLRTVDG